MQLVTAFEVLGRCVPWSMPTPVWHNGKMKFAGKIQVLTAWQECVAEAARVAMHGKPIVLDPIMLFIEFYRETPSGRTHGDWWDVRVEAKGTGYVKPGSSQPDLVNLFKGTEDALERIVIGNDAQTSAIVAKRLYGPQDGVRVKVYAIGRGVSGDDLTPFTEASKEVQKPNPLPPYARPSVSDVPTSEFFQPPVL